MVRLADCFADRQRLLRQFCSCPTSLSHLFVFFKGFKVAFSDSSIFKDFTSADPVHLAKEF